MMNTSYFHGIGNLTLQGFCADIETVRVITTIGAIFQIAMIDLARIGFNPIQVVAEIV